MEHLTTRSAVVPNNLTFIPHTFLNHYTLHELNRNKITSDLVLYFWKALYLVIDSVPSSLSFFTTGDDGVEMSGDVFPQQVKIKELL